MSDFSLILVLQLKTSKICNDMANVSIKSEKITPFGGVFHVMEQFERHIGPVIDDVLGLRCTTFGYRYSEIVRSLMSVYFCGGDCVEDVSSHLMPHLSRHPRLRTCSSDTILRGISELTTSNTTYTSDAGAQNTVFLLLTALIRNFYRFLIERLGAKAFGLDKTSRIKAFVFRFISVPAKWIRTARAFRLNIYTDNLAYQDPFPPPADG